MMVSSRHMMMKKPLCFVGTTTAAVSVVSIASSSRMRQWAAWKLRKRIWNTSCVDRVRVRLTANNACMKGNIEIGFLQVKCNSF